MKNRNIVTLFLIVLLGSCENPLVQDLLRSAAVLENISINADDPETHYSLAPMFNTETTEYTVTVPFTARTITVNGRPRRDGTVTYRMGDGETFGGETGSGVFDFPEELTEAVILIRVERPYMDTRVYTLTLVRGIDSLLRALELRAGPSEGAIDSSPRPLSPGFHPEEYTYTVGVPSDAEVLNIEAKTKPGALVQYEQFDKDGLPVPDSFPGQGLFAFPKATMDLTKIRITVSMDGETVSYWLTVRRPGRVYAPRVFTIIGGKADDPVDDLSVHFFDQGEPVVFRADPPFGHLMSSVTRRDLDDSGNPVPDTDTPLTSETDLYGFVMPGGSVIIEGSYTKIEGEENILYVRGLTDEEIALLEDDPDAIPPGNGSSWADASLNLQEMIDQWNPGEEIWISAGKVRPDWTGVTPGVSGHWARDLNQDHVKKKANWWSFVLKDEAQIYGGFKGTETAKNQRDPAKYETILSGDLGEWGKVKHVVVAAGVSGVRLDGLTISGGDCLVDIYDASFKINGKVLTPSTYLYGVGGGLINIDASPWLNNVIIKGNNASNGAVFNWNSLPVLTNVTISNSSGGGIYSTSSSKLLMIGGSVSGNQGDGVFTKDSSSILINVAVRRNTGYGVKYEKPISADLQRLINLTIEDNDSGWIYYSLNAGNTSDRFDVSTVVYNSILKGERGQYNSVSESYGVVGEPVNTRENNVEYPQDPADYWPLANNGSGGPPYSLNTAGLYASGGDLYAVYDRLSALPAAIQTEIFPLLENLPSMGAKE